MADTLIARNEGSTYTPPPEGQHQAVCVDTVDLGEKVESYQNGPEKLVHKCAIVWQIDERDSTNKRYEVSQEYTFSFGEKAALRKLLSAWRGKSYSNEEAAKGVELHKLVGHNCMLQIEHKTSGSGKTYARVLSATPLHKSIPKIGEEGYARWDGWAKRKADYLDGARKFNARSGNGSQGSDEFEDYPDSLDEDDSDSSLPF